MSKTSPAGTNKAVAEDDRLAVLGFGSRRGRDIPCHGSGFRASFVSIREGRVIRHITSAKPQATQLFRDALVGRMRSVGSRRVCLKNGDTAVEAAVEVFRGRERSIVSRDSSEGVPRVSQ